MQICVKLFALFRDRAGTAEVAIDLPAGGTAGDVIAAVIGRYPELMPFENRVAVAVNLTMVARSAVIQSGDEVALIPPVSGGIE
jgi:molybdopterin converting factor subunit 1